VGDHDGRRIHSFDFAKPILAAIHHDSSMAV
jgi:hypothetical protein